MQQATKLLLRVSLLMWLLISLSSCHSDNGEPQLFAVDAYPEQLSRWQVLSVTQGKLTFGAGVQSYDINMPLFSDYAGKLRTLWMPQGTSLNKATNGDRGFQYPLGTIISKTFFYQAGSTTTGKTVRVAAANRFRTNGKPLALDNIHLVETRLLVRHAHGWHAVSYQWRGDEAYLAITGAIVPLALESEQGATRPTEFPYLIPSRNQCAGCHATDHSTGQLRPIGLHAAQLGRPAPSNSNQEQLHLWQQWGWLKQSEPVVDASLAWPSWEGEADTTLRARAYLDSNCGHCHTPRGPADTSALDLSMENQDPAALGWCKAPIAAGRGSGGRLFSIVPGAADESILVYRLASTSLRSRMPEVGRSLQHGAGVALVSDWVNSLTGECR